jgi:hypothetical protein
MAEDYDKVIEQCRAACTCPKSGPSAPTIGMMRKPAIQIGHKPLCPALQIIWRDYNAREAASNEPSSYYQAVNETCANCGRAPSEHKQYRDAKPPHCPRGTPPADTTKPAEKP